jgi:hypothetical protein
MPPITGKGDAGVSALVPSRRFPRGVVLTLVLLLLIGLFFSRPTATQFAQYVWMPTLKGVKADLEERREQSAVYKFVETFLNTPYINIFELAKAGKEAELNRLPAFWMEHTTVYDWKLVTYFRYDEANCFSDYLGVAGRLVNLKDGCEVEPYRAKGGSL